MTETPSEPSGHRRKRHGGSNKSPTKISGLTLLKIGALGLGATIAGAKTIDYVHNMSSENELEDFRKTIPTLPNTILSPDQEQTFSQEGWSDKFQVPSISPDSNPSETKAFTEGVAQKSLAELNEKMSASVFEVFPETLKYISSYFHKDVPGKLDLVLDFFPRDKTGGDTVFLTAMDVGISGGLEVKFAANAWLFSPAAQPERNDTLTKLVWALGLAHEKDHHALSLKMFEFWKSKGLSPNEAFDKVVNDEYQEPFAYWNQAAATYPMLPLLSSSSLPDSFVTASKKWKELNDKGITWYDQKWTDFVNQDLVTRADQLTNIPLKQANMEQKAKILAAQPLSGFMA